MIWVDAAFPPNPSQWVADMNAVGAEGGFYYAWGGFTHYTPAHLQAARLAGKHTAAIIVPGNDPGSVASMLDAVSALGGSGDPVVFDIETQSFPPPQWLATAISAARQAGHAVYRYGNWAVNELAKYPEADGDWVSHGPGLFVHDGRVVSYQPVPPVPVPAVAWQYIVDVRINGSEYDLSTAVPTFFGTKTVVAQHLGGEALGFLSRDITQDPLDEVYVGINGHCYWGYFKGGAGEWVSSNSPLTDLGSPNSAGDLVKAEGCFSTHDGVLRLNIHGTQLSGKRWIKVMDAGNFTVIEDWSETSSSPDELVPAASGGVPKHRHSATIGDPV